MKYWKKAELNPLFSQTPRSKHGNSQSRNGRQQDHRRSKDIRNEADTKRRIPITRMADLDALVPSSFKQPNSDAKWKEGEEDTQCFLYPNPTPKKQKNDPCQKLEHNGQNGQVVDQIVGAVPKSKIKELLDKVS